MIYISFMEGIKRSIRLKYENKKREAVWFPFYKNILLL